MPDSDLPNLNQHIAVDPEHGLIIKGKLTLCDNEGRPFCVLGCDCDGGFIHLLNKTGGVGVSVGCDANAGFVDIRFHDEPRLAVTITGNADGGIVELYDKRGNTLTVLPNTTQENAGT